METETAADPQLNPHIAEWYGERYDEIDRLSVKAIGRLEHVRTRELLQRHLPPAPAKVLDVGGGPGVYAAWLAELGYDVSLVDPVARHCEQAAAYGTFEVSLGDARALAAADASVDIVLMMGPLYHLIDPAERAQALREARRVVRADGGLIAAAFISRQAPILDVAAKLAVNDDETYAKLGKLKDSGEHVAGTGFTVAYFHQLDEVYEDFAAAGLDRPRVFGIEGPMHPLLVSGLVEDSAAHFEAVLRAARLADDHSELLPASSHLLAVLTV